jgi:uncharacterized membrane protein YdjX (TVP38/TMEM64 family)
MSVQESRESSFPKFLTLVLLLGTGVILFRLSPLADLFDTNQLSHLGVWTVPTYILLFALALTTGLPAGVFALSAGALFGPWWGTLWALCGGMLGATLAFFLARSLGREQVEHWVKQKRWDRWDELIENRGFEGMVYARLLPTPYSIVSFAAGLSKVRFRDYWWGSLLGNLPGMAAFVWIGHAGLAFGSKQGGWQTVLFAIGAGCLIIGPALWVRRRLGAREKAALGTDRRQR